MFKRIGVVVLLLAGVSAAQELRTLRGEVTSETAEDYSALTIRLSHGMGDPPEDAHVEHDGRFTFYGLNTGIYVLQVLDAQHDLILSDQVIVSPANGLVTVKLPEPKRDTPTGQTVSAARLLHPPDKRAMREAAKAQQFAESGSYERSAGEWQKAVALDPYFSDGYNNLGVQYVRLGRLPEAAEAFRRATEISPNAVTEVNLAVTLGKMGSLAEAEQWARAAVRLDPANTMAPKVLDGILAVERRSARK